MFSDHWNVLLVDDEPDVLSVSKLAMRKFEVYGQPLRLHTATSKAQALDLLKGELTRQAGYPNLAVAFIDVVMETDAAGLELCQVIRETMQNRMTALYVRTGQPGLAPERTVIDRYDLSGYFTKVEATEDKLYSLVKTGVRQYFTTQTALTHFEVLSRLTAVSGSRERLRQVLEGAVSAHQRDAAGKPVEGLDYRRWFIEDGKVIASSSKRDELEAMAVHDRLQGLPGHPLSADGDRVVTDGTNMLIRIAATPSTAEIHDVMMCRFLPPDFLVGLLYRFTKSFSTLWLKGR
jgi:CheY-like chemotaxis protein